MQKVSKDFVSKISVVGFMFTGRFACKFAKNLLNEFMLEFQNPFSTSGLGYVIHKQFQVIIMLFKTVTKELKNKATLSLKQYCSYVFVFIGKHSWQAFYSKSHMKKLKGCRKFV